MLGRVSFPFSVKEGRLEVSEGTRAAQEAIQALVNINSGELPMSRDYGADLEYNIAPQTAYQHIERLSQRLAEYHPHLSLTQVEPVLSEEGVVLDWAIGVEVEDN